ncbi:MAG: GAF and ANTAR domain-containing protein [Mycobacterium sp.]
MSDYDAQRGRTTAGESELSCGQPQADEEKLQFALRGLRKLVGGAGSLNARLSEIAHLAAQAIPGVDGVSVAALDVSDGYQQVQAWEITAPFVRDLDILQYVLLNQGPSIACKTSQLPIVSMSLTTDTRWRRLAARLTGLGVESALSLPLLTGDQVIGSINCYAHDRAAFGHRAVQLGMTFAKPAAISLENLRLQRIAQDKAEHLHRSLEGHSVIDQAIGIVRGRTDGSGQDALGQLQQLGGTQRVDFEGIAHRIVEQSVRHAYNRRSNPRGA